MKLTNSFLSHIKIRKFGLDENELRELMNSSSLKELNHVRICGLMGMASFTEDEEKIRKEFHYLKSLFDKFAQLQTLNSRLQTLSMGMSSDYHIAIEEGSTMVRIGSLIFGQRNHSL